jgi:hypothetical protein
LVKNRLKELTTHKPSTKLFAISDPGGTHKVFLQEKRHMIKKFAAFIVLTFLVVPFASFAQSPAGAGKSIEDLNVADIADDSIIMLSSEETGVPGYVYQKYAFLCFGQFRLVDHYGAPIDPKDPSVIQFERQMCSKQEHADDGSDNE